ncbi:MAG: helix-turn-helix transcriptional regulator [Dehalococcoidales bacterium]|nr:helix-turn-helix transcriptional regulator [Dehalococcoidales bacterium]
MKKFHIRSDIRRFRFNNGEMTQQELAEKVGVTRQTIAAIEKSRYSPSLELAFRIARIFDAPLTEMFFYEENEKENSR